MTAKNRNTKKTTATKKRLRRSLEIFKLLGSILGSRIDILWINIFHHAWITVEFDKWFNSFIWIEVYSVIKERVLPPELLHDLGHCK